MSGCTSSHSPHLSPECPHSVSSSSSEISKLTIHQRAQLHLHELHHHLQITRSQLDHHEMYSITDQSQIQHRFPDLLPNFTKKKSWRWWDLNLELPKDRIERLRSL